MQTNICAALTQWSFDEQPNRLAASIEPPQRFPCPIKFLLSEAKRLDKTARLRRAGRHLLEKSVALRLRNPAKSRLLFGRLGCGGASLNEREKVKILILNRRLQT